MPFPRRRLTCLALPAMALPCLGGSFVDLATAPPERVLRLDGFASDGLVARSVAGAGDVDQDGFDDLLIGAPRLAFGGLPDAGAVFLVRGGSQVDTLGQRSLALLAPPDGLTILSDGVGLALGASVAGIGDINGDGAPDIALGAPEFSNAAPTSGQAYVLFGGASLFARSSFNLEDLEPSEGFLIQGRALGNELGRSVASAGDVNADGVPDFIVGEPFADGSELSVAAGAAAVIFGGESLMETVAPAGVLLISVLDGRTGFLVQGREFFGLLGERVAAAGDLNDDGLDDLLISADGEGPSDRPNAGRAYAVFAAPPPIDEGRVIVSGIMPFDGIAIDGPEPEGITSFALAGAADLDGDGVDDIIISSPNAAPNGDRSGLVHVLFGPRERQADPIDLLAVGPPDALVIRGAEGDQIIGGQLDAGDVAGFAVAAGDFTGDGVDDLAIASPGANDGDRINVGMVAILRGGPSLRTRGVIDLAAISAADAVRIRAIDFNETAGRSLAFVGDMNGDGCQDLVIGSPGARDGAARGVGRAYVVFGFEPLAADLNNDGAVGHADLARLLGRWGQIDLAADLDGDDAVGAADLALLLQDWGASSSARR